MSPIAKVDAKRITDPEQILDIVGNVDDPPLVIWEKPCGCWVEEFNGTSYQIQLGNQSWVETCLEKAFAHLAEWHEDEQHCG